MTESEFNNLQSQGKVETVNAMPPVPVTEPPLSSFDEYVPVLESMRRPRKYLAAAPTFIPKTFADSIQPFDNGTTKGFYLYVNGVWVQLNSTSNTTSIFDKFIDLVHWNSLDGFATTLGGGANMNAQDSLVYMSVTGGAGSVTTTGLHSSDQYRKLFETGKTTTVEFQIAYINGTDLGLRAYLVMIAQQAVPFAETFEHVGFKLLGTGAPLTNTSPVEIYATSADGTTQLLTNTGVTIPSLTVGRTRLKLVFINGTSCKFYVDGVLLATHTTNLPTGSDVGVNLSIWSRVSAQDRSIRIGRVLIEKEY